MGGCKSDFEGISKYMIICKDGGGILSAAIFIFRIFRCMI
jgi:hypothetical protein